MSHSGSSFAYCRQVKVSFFQRLQWKLAINRSNNVQGRAVWSRRWYFTVSRDCICENIGSRRTWTSIFMLSYKLMHESQHRYQHLVCGIHLGVARNPFRRVGISRFTKETAPSNAMSDNPEDDCGECDGTILCDSTVYWLGVGGSKKNENCYTQ